MAMNREHAEAWAARRTAGGNAEVVPQQEMAGDSSSARIVLPEQVDKLGEVIEALDGVKDPDEALVEIRNDLEDAQTKLEDMARRVGAQPTEEQDETESESDADEHED